MGANNFQPVQSFGTEASKKDATLARNNTRIGFLHPGLTGLLMGVLCRGLGGRRPLQGSSRFAPTAGLQKSENCSVRLPAPPVRAALQPAS